MKIKRVVSVVALSFVNFITFILYFIFGIAETFPLAKLQIATMALFGVVSFVFGVFSEFKFGIIGLVVFEVGLIVYPFIQFLAILSPLFCVLNPFYIWLHDYVTYDLLRYVVSVVAPIIPFAIGLGIAKARTKKQAAK